MIRITIEMVPRGNEAKKYTMGSATITNDGTGTKTRGNYVFRQFSKTGRQLASVDVWDFPRGRMSVWYLLHWALNNAFNKQQTTVVKLKGSVMTAEQLKKMFRDKYTK